MNMANFRVHTIETAPEASRPLLDELRKRNGMLSNFQLVMAEAPATLEMYSASARALHGGRLSRVERETVALAVSVEQRCDYCVASHSAAALRQKIAPEIVTALREAKPLGDAKLEALRTFALRTVRQRGVLTAEELAELAAAGYDNGHLLEALGWVAHMTLTNYINHLAHVPLDKAFEPQRWSP
jgi:uncharacterized peroxidase-related enzyme